MICRFGWPIGSKAWEDRKVGGAPKITHGVTTHSATMVANGLRAARVRLSNYRRHAHRGIVHRLIPGIDERPVPQEPRRKDVAGTKRARPGRKIWRRQLLWVRRSERSEQCGRTRARRSLCQLRSAAPVKQARDDYLAERRRELVSGAQAEGATAPDAAILADACVNAARRVMTELLAQRAGVPYGRA